MNLSAAQQLSAKQEEKVLWYSRHLQGYINWILRSLFPFNSISAQHLWHIIFNWGWIYHYVSKSTEINILIWPLDSNEGIRIGHGRNYGYATSCDLISQDTSLSNTDVDDALWTNRSKWVSRLSLIYGVNRAAWGNDFYVVLGKWFTALLCQIMFSKSVMRHDEAKMNKRTSHLL